MVIQATALSPANNLHWFQLEMITPMIGIVASLVDDCSYHIWHQHFGHTSQNALQPCIYPFIRCFFTHSPC